ncbi:unnamed protein product [Prunus armeniaca]|uniref:F-box associated beta-propeller type 3 domain-containing protein n=1 Tax=Prunus armeniaca TaxID=36596 RepID=A0A6J5W1S5_PRUAR|nr:unnamed protein product [Prunus armeniaca]
MQRKGQSTAMHITNITLGSVHSRTSIRFSRCFPGDKWDLVFNTFTLGRDSWWRPLQVDHGDLPFDALAYVSDSYGKSTASVCLNGAVYWIYEKQKMLVAFDVEEETFKALPLPEDYDQVFANYYADQDYENYSSDNANDYCCPTMVKVGGCVGVFADMSWKHDKILLWILKDYQNIVWVKETISLASEREDLGYQRYIEALGTIHTGEFALVHYFLGFSPGYDDGPPELRLYDMKSKQYRVGGLSTAIKRCATNPELPAEIIFAHILPRLPAKDLMTQCRWVCKSWSSLIRSPSFVTAFCNFHRNDTPYFFFQQLYRFLSPKN